MENECKLGFTKVDNTLAYELYQKAKPHITCDQFDQGYGVTNLSGNLCHPAEEKSCVVAALNGVIEAEEVIERLTEEHKKFGSILAGEFGEPLPWILERLKETQLYQKIISDIETIKKFVKKTGAKESSGSFNERLAIALYYYVLLPNAKEIKKDVLFYKDMTSELVVLGMHEYRAYLIQHGGLAPRLPSERLLTADESLITGKMQGRELSYILLAIYELAGLKDFRPFMGRYAANAERDRLVTYRMHYDSAGTDINGVVVLTSNQNNRFFNPNRELSNNRYSEAYPGNYRQFLSNHYSYKAAEAANDSDLDSAINLFNRAIQIDPQNAMALNALGAVWARKHVFEKAMDYYTRAIEIDPEFGIAYINRGGIYIALEGTPGPIPMPELYLASQNYENALRDFQKGIEILKRQDPQHPQISKASIGIGFIRMKQGDSQAALEIQAQLPPLFSKHKKSHWPTDRELYGYFSSEKQPKQISPKDFKSYFETGTQHAANKEYREAVIAFTKALYANPNSAEAYCERGLAWENLGNEDRALQDRQEATLISPKIVKKWLAKKEKLKSETTNGQPWVHNDGTAAPNSEIDRKKLAMNKIHNDAIVHLKKGELKKALENITTYLLTADDQEANIFYAEIIQASRERWQTNQVAEAFHKQTKWLYIHREESLVLYTFARWQAGQKAQARLSMLTAVNSLKFETGPSKPVKDYLVKLFKLMPTDMKKDPELKELIDKLEVIIQ